MPRTRLGALVLLASVLAACSEPVAPVAPTEPELAPRFAAIVTHEELVVPVDVTEFIECAGEQVRFTGSLVFRVHRVLTPSGRGMLHVTVMPHSPDPVEATGLTSQTVWTFASGASAQTVITKDGVTQNVNVTRNETYVAADGSVLALRSGFHLRARDGEPLIVERGGWTCR